MVYVQGGAFAMGCTGGLCGNNEFPRHQVRVSSFEIGRYEVTQALWERVMGENPSSFKGCAQCPVDGVSWDAVQIFIGKLNALTGDQYRLPTEAEWEYAARGGQQSRGYAYAGSDHPRRVAWINSRKTRPVGQKRPNELELYDMSGNVAEWVQDWYGDYPSGSVTDPQGPPSGPGRVVRGGDWHLSDFASRVSYRHQEAPGSGEQKRWRTLGFRLARDSS